MLTAANPGETSVMLNNSEADTTRLCYIPIIIRRRVSERERERERD